MSIAVPYPRLGTVEKDDAHRIEVGRVHTFTERHPWLTTAALVAVQVLASLFRVAEIALSEYAGRLLAPTILLAAVAVTVVALRRRWPLTLLLTLAVLVPLVRWMVTGDLRDPVYLSDETAPLGTEQRLPATPGFAAWVLLGTAAARRPARMVWPVVAVYVALGVACSALWVPRADLGYVIAIETTIAVIAVLVGTNRRIHRQRVAVLEDRARQLALERDQREQIAVTSERNRIAREMHDVVAHSLSVMITLAEGASAMLERNPDQARRALDELAETGRSSLADARRLVGVLREGGATPVPDGGAAPLAPQPTERDVAVLVERFRGAGLPVRFTESGPPLPDDALLHLAVYRIVQEALTNVLRHAPASPRIDVTIERTFERVVIVVDNDAGPGSPTISGSNRGLIGIRERAAAYSGTVDAGPTPTGWRTRALLRLS